MARRLKDLRRAHYYFEQAGDLVNSDPRSMHEFAQAKLDSARKAYRDRDRITNRKLLSESRQLLERVLQYEAPPIRHAWAWRDLARTLYWQRESFGISRGGVRTGHSSTSGRNSVCARVKGTAGTAGSLSNACESSGQRAETQIGKPSDTAFRMARSQENVLVRIVKPAVARDSLPTSRRDSGRQASTSSLITCPPVWESCLNLPPWK